MERCHASKEVHQYDPAMTTAQGQTGLYCGQGDESQIKYIASTYRLPVVAERSTTAYRFLLILEDGVLKLYESGNTRYRPIFVNINDARRLSRRSVLGRAIGRRVETVVDATAGLGGDSLLLARMGFSVLAIERHAVVSALLEDGISRIVESFDHLAIEHCYVDARLQLSQLSELPEVIYLDPMYPAGRKSSVKVARPIQVVRDLVGDDPDFESLFEIALKFARKRVVLKRPTFAESLQTVRLTRSLPGKMVRYDIYDTG